MSAPDSVYFVTPGPGAVSTLKWISIRVVLPIVICGTIAVGLQTTIAGGPKLVAADLPQLASPSPDTAFEEAAPVAPPRQFAAPGHGPGNARQEAAAAMLLLLVAAAKKRDGGAAQHQAAEAERPVSRQQTADAGQVR